MITKRRETKVKEQLYNAYNGNLAYIERVLNSCETEEQLDNALIWASNYLDNINIYEHRRRSAWEGFVVSDYILHRRLIFLRVHERKQEKINKFFVTNDVD